MLGLVGSILVFLQSEYILRLLINTLNFHGGGHTMNVYWICCLSAHLKKIIVRSYTLLLSLPVLMCMLLTNHITLYLLQVPGHEACEAVEQP